MTTPTAEQYIAALHAASDVLNRAAADAAQAYDLGQSVADIEDIAEIARQVANTAYRKAIGAHCEGCGGNSEQHIGNS